jgi:hypothetical protein
MNAPKNFIKDDSQSYLQNLVDDKRRFLDDNVKYSKMFILSKIQPQANNENINKETKFPIVADLTAYYSLNGHTDISVLSRKGSGWDYFDKLVLKDNENISLNSKNYKVEVSTLRNIMQKEIILRDLENNNLVKIDLKNTDNLDYLYKQIELNQKQKLKNNSKIKP